jgi:hypothetical protein
MSNILDHIVVSFGDHVTADTAFAVVEIDPNAKNADGSDKTEFYQDEVIPLFLHMHPSLSLSYTKVTSGMLVVKSSSSRLGSQKRVFFPTVDSIQSLPHIPSGNISISKYYGNTSGIQLNGMQVKADSPPCICDISYTYYGIPLELRPPTGLSLAKGETWPVGAVLHLV